MQPCAGCWAARRLLASPAPTPADQSMDAERAHLGRVLGVTTMVLLVASFSYLAVSTLYGCLRAARVVHAPPGNDDDPAPAETLEDTKRALAGIPVQLVVFQQFPRDSGGARNDDEADADDCAVCLAEFAAGEEVRVLPACRHGFHRECVDRWLLTRAPTCPVCRAPLAASMVDDSHAKQADWRPGTASTSALLVATSPAARSRRCRLWCRLPRAPPRTVAHHHLASE